MGYEVHQFENGAGDVWYQVGRRSWLFWIKWDVSWPWSVTASFREIPSRYETVDEAYDRVDELMLRDKVSVTRRLGPVGRPAPIENILDEIGSRPEVAYLYAATPISEETTVTETKPKARRPRKKKK